MLSRCNSRNTRSLAVSTSLPFGILSHGRKRERSQDDIGWGDCVCVFFGVKEQQSDDVALCVNKKKEGKKLETRMMLLRYPHIQSTDRMRSIVRNNLYPKHPKQIK